MSEFKPGDVLHFRDNDTTYVVNTKGYLYQSRTKAGYGPPQQRVWELNSGGPVTVNGEPYDPPVDLDALPVGSVVKDAAGDTMAKSGDGWLILVGVGAPRVRPGRNPATLFPSNAIEQPVTVVFKP